MKLIANLVALFSVVYLTGCNTVQGLGKDMQQGGQELQRVAKENLR